MAFSDLGLVRPNKLRFRVYTRDHWLDGQFKSIHRRLIDLLNSEDAQVGVVAEEVSIQGDGCQPGHEVRFDHASVNVTSVLLAIPMEGSDDPPPRDPYVWVRKRPVKVSIATGPYQVMGDIYLIEDGRLREVLQILKTRFIAVGNAAVSRVDDATFRETHEVVLVNRNLLTLIAPAPGTAPDEPD